MSMSFTATEPNTFTLTHARHVAAKVATDLKRLQRFYGSPSDADISKYEAEVIAMYKAGYLDRVSYGFRRNGNWIEPSFHYAAKDLFGASTTDDDPGGIRAAANITGASFYSYMTNTSAWYALTDEARHAFESTLPFQRSAAPAPGVEGHTVTDRIYSAGGKALERTSVRSY